MAGSAWKRLADHLETAGMHNPYHARLKAKLPAVDGVHREAIGFRLNGDLAERYPIPPKRRLDQP